MFESIERFFDLSFYYMAWASFILFVIAIGGEWAYKKIRGKR